MPKRIINDILVSKKSIRQIPIMREKKVRAEKVTSNRDEEVEIVSTRLTRATSWQRKPLNPKFVIWSLAGICLLALFFGISIIFSSATIIITPRTEKIVFSSETFTAKSDVINSDSLTFEVLKVKQTAGEIVEATEEKEVSQKASGKIIIYNNYSTTPQRLINNTRFEATGGKVYRINTSVIVPGLKKVNGKVVPGSVEAVVFADQAGEDYNLRLNDLAGDFKIPGFKGDPRYDGFYARLKDDISGGFIGRQRIVEDGVRKAAEENIKLKLKEQLLKELYAVKPDNYLIFKDGYSVDYTGLSDTPVESNKVKINIEGNLSGIVFNSLKLANYLATKKISKFDALPVEFIPSDDLVTTLVGKDMASLWKNSSLDITLSGEAIIKWQYDGAMIKRDFAGKKETDLKNLMTKYRDSVKEMKVLFRPVWTRYMPDNPNKIKISEEAILW